MKKPLSSHLRKLSYQERISILSQRLHLEQEESQLLSEHVPLADLADVLVEGSIGTFGIPWGIAEGFVINGQEFLVPMATEEPSVIAAAMQGATLARAGGGFTATSSASWITTQIFIERYAKEAQKHIESSREHLGSLVNQLMPNMVRRGGGFRGLDVTHLAELDILCVSIHLDVCDAMGANIANTIGEGLREPLSLLTKGRIAMAILTNASEQRMARASFRIPQKYLKKGSVSGEEVCRRIVQANAIACHDPKRAVTHNKGIMNGVTALTLCTGNDTRAIEAAAHFHAQTGGTYLPLTKYRHEAEHLLGEIELPIALGVAGGAISIWPYARIALKILGNPKAAILGQVTASLGLAQNLSALYALVTDGIQAGHMPLHAARIAYQAGARGKEVREVAALLWDRRSLQETEAQKVLETLRNS